MNIASVIWRRRFALVIVSSAHCVWAVLRKINSPLSRQICSPNLANVAAIALENARLFAQAERVATLEERRRVAAEMHDGLGKLSVISV